MGATIPTLDEMRAAWREDMERLLEPIRRALPPSLVSIEQAAEILGVSIATVRRRVKAREYPTKRVGRQIKIDATALHPEREAEIVDLAAQARAR